MDPSSFKEFYEATSRGLWAYLFRLTGDAELASDIQQESYLRFLQKPCDGKHEQQMKTYLYTIATRLNIDRWKRGNVHKRWQLSLAEHRNGSLTSPEERIGLKTDMEGVFKQLKQQERALLWLAYIEEQSHRAIGEILGMKEKSVRVALFRARKKLVRILDKQGLGAEVIS